MVLCDCDKFYLSFILNSKIQVCKNVVKDLVRDKCVISESHLSPALFFEFCNLV